MGGSSKKAIGRDPVGPSEDAGADEDEFDWLFPPDTVTDPAAWDRYWNDQLSHGEAWFVHLFVDDGELVDVMRASALRTVLCVGNGISQEPRALAWAGFDVTALDLSPFAAEVASGCSPPDEALADLVGGRSAGRNGSLRYVVGDLCDPKSCPGPYDVVIDRSTLQLFPDEQLPIAMRSVAGRLAIPGIFMSQSHDGRWRPGTPERNVTKSWFVAEGWNFWRGETPVTSRVAWSITTTG